MIIKGRGAAAEMANPIVYAIDIFFMQQPQSDLLRKMNLRFPINVH